MDDLISFELTYSNVLYKLPFAGIEIVVEREKNEEDRLGHVEGAKHRRQKIRRKKFTKSLYVIDSHIVN